MPCRDDVDWGSDQGYKRRLDMVTRAACDMRTILRRHELEGELCQETRDWIVEHDQADAARLQQAAEQKAREDAKQRGIAKLTLEERRALGL